MDRTDGVEAGEWLRLQLEDARKRRASDGGVGFTLDEASLMLAIALDQSPSWEARFRDHMGAALHAGQLQLRDAETGVFLPAHLQIADDWGRITRDDVNRWLEGQGLPYRWSDAEQLPESSPLRRAESPRRAASSNKTAPPMKAARHVLASKSGPLTAVYEQARSLAVDRNDAHSVFASMQALALSKNPPPPLVGWVEEGIQYRKPNSDDLKLFKVKDIRERLRRERKKQS